MKRPVLQRHKCYSRVWEGEESNPSSPTAFNEIKLIGKTFYERKFQTQRVSMANSIKYLKINTKLHI